MLMVLVFENGGGAGQSSVSLEGNLILPKEA
jgi:hypothetical protein